MEGIITIQQVTAIRDVNNSTFKEFNPISHYKVTISKGEDINSTFFIYDKNYPTYETIVKTYNDKK